MRHPLRMSDCNSRGNLHLVIPPPYGRGVSPVSCCSSSISIKKQLFCQEEQEIVGHTSVLSTPPLIHSSRILVHLVLHTQSPLLQLTSYHTPPPDHRVDAVDERVEIALDNHSPLIPAPAHSVYFSHKSLQLLWVLSAPPHKL